MISYLNFINLLTQKYFINIFIHGGGLVVENAIKIAIDWKFLIKKIN